MEGYVCPCCGVTPFVGVWIETLNGDGKGLTQYVTPFVGVWIETYDERLQMQQQEVTPFVGVWIETRATA